MSRLNPLTETATPVRRTRYSKPPWEVVECLETGMVFLLNPPAYDELEERFAWEKTFAEEAARRRAEEPVVARLSGGLKAVRKKFRRRRRIEKLLCAALLDSKAAWALVDARPQVVDVGCGSARNLCRVAADLRAVHGREITPVGLEISRALAAEADANLRPWGGRCIHGSALAGLHQFADDSVHGIMLHSYLEHEVQPLPALRAMQDKLVPGGVIVIKVPNFGCLNRRLRQERWCGFRYPDHVNYFTPATLGALIRRSGLHLKPMRIWDRFPTNDNMYAVVEKR